MRESWTEGHLIRMGTKRFITTHRVTLFHGIFPTVQVSLSYTHTKHPPPPSRPPRALHTETPPLKKTKKVVVFHAVEPCAAKKKLFLFSLKVDVGAKRRCLLVLGRNFDNKDSCLHVSGCQRATFPASRQLRRTPSPPQRKTVYHVLHGFTTETVCPRIYNHLEFI